MAVITIDFKSQVLNKNTHLNIILPELANNFTDKPQDYACLYLLHGLTDDESAWLRYTTLESYLAKTNLCVVMPEVDHSFYTNMAHGGHKYFDYITRELPLYIESILPIVKDRHARFIAGASMGGYGAMKAALTYPEKYGKVAVFSGALDIDRFVHEYTEEPWCASWVFGDVDGLAGTDNDVLYLLEKDVAANKNLPEIWTFCGDDDFLLQDTCKFEDLADSLGIKVDGHRSAGGHIWQVWQNQLEDCLGWILQAE